MPAKQTVGERLAEEFYDVSVVDPLLVSALAAAIDRALQEQIEKDAGALCKWCGNDAYDLFFHHGEWRHYRKTDMHVEYCKAAAIRGQGETK